MWRTGRSPFDDGFLFAAWSQGEPVSAPTPTPTPPASKPWPAWGRALFWIGLWALSLAGVAGYVWFKMRPLPGPPQPVPAIVLPASVTAHVGRIVTIEAQTGGKIVSWDVLTGPDKPDLLVHDDHAVHFVTPTAGDYRLEAITVVDGKPAKAETHVLVDAAPGPGPGPGPGPTDPLTLALQTAFAAETDPAKAQQVAVLASLYKCCDLSDSSLKTNGELLARMHSAAAILFGETAEGPAKALLKIRNVIADELDKSLGTSPATTIDRPKAAAEFTKISAALGGLK